MRDHHPVSFKSTEGPGGGAVDRGHVQLGPGGGPRLRAGLTCAQRHSNLLIYLTR
jgi:hypothetical protein